MPLVRVEGDKIVSLKIEYNLTDHCNYGCDECSHFSPYLTRKESSLEGFRKDLAALARVMRVYRFRFVGGEPLPGHPRPHRGGAGERHRGRDPGLHQRRAARPRA